MVDSPQDRYLSAVEEVGQWLAAIGHDKIVELTTDECHSYFTRKAKKGWRLTVRFSDGQDRHLDLLLDAEFPRTLPLVALVYGPAAYTWPHVESDGVLCVAPIGSVVDVAKPVDIVRCMLMDATALIEELISGGRQDDLRQEFLSYWERHENRIFPQLFSLVAPEPPSRPISIWKGRSFYLFADNNAELANWLRNFGVKGKSHTFYSSVLIWLDRPMVPIEYPHTAEDLIRLASDPRIENVFRSIARQRPDEVVALLGASAINGPCLAGITLKAPKRTGDGFRPSHTPGSVLARRYLRKNRTWRTTVGRVDPAWIHGRGQNPSEPILREKKVAILGCGSLGSPIAIALAKAGVGGLSIVDPEILVPANIGRHVLGFCEIGKSKAEAMSRLISEAHPHMAKVEGWHMSWQDWASKYAKSAESCDVFISTSARWSAESALNEWHIASARSKPIVYGWTEAHACAGHAVAVYKNGGCLQCGMSTLGVPKLEATQWDGDQRKTEPACGAFFQPYGPVELGYIANLVAEIVIECLLGDVARSTHRVWAAREAVLAKAGGKWTEAWLTKCGGRNIGGCVESFVWETDPDCIECGL